MKKKVLLFILMAILMLSGIIKAQTNGSWILPFLNNLIPEADRLEFGQTIQPNYLQTLTENSYSFSAGAFDQDGTLLFYLIDEKIYDANSNYIDDIYSTNPVEDIFNAEVEIVRSPYIDENVIKFFIIWSASAPVNGENDGGFFYNEVAYNKSTGQINVADFQELPYYTQPPNGYNYGAFAVSKPENGTKYLYRCTQVGITKCEITPTGFSSNVNLVLSSDDPTIGNSYNFIAYNFEMKKNSAGKTVFAWNTKYAYGGADRDKIFVYNVEDDDSKVIDIDANSTGYINGLEFSTFNDDIIYVSYDSDGSGSGLYEMDYIDESTTLISSNNEYSHTFLQIAPDRNIYGVSNDGSNFCKIDMNTGVFQPNAFSNGNVITYRGNNNYILPENEQLPLDITTSQLNIACEGSTDGWAMAGSTGGIPPYNYEWTDQSGDIISTSPVADNLGAGTYTCCITDSDIPPVTVCQNVTIIVDHSLLNYTQHNMVDIYSGTQNWNNNNYDKFETGIFVHNGADFTISNSYLEFGENAKIIVEQGATLTIDNTTLTCLSECPVLWQGIEVWGNPNESQINGAQGELDILNGSVIEYAEMAVLLSKKDSQGDSYNGGIVKATGTVGNEIKFKNNRRVFEAPEYHNIINGHEYENLSSFNRCIFTLDQTFIGGSPSGIQIALQGVKGINFFICSFDDNFSLTPSLVAIQSLDAGYSVLGYCSSTTSPCPEEDIEYTYFHNFRKAIQASNTTSNYTVFVKYCNFFQNSYGVQLSKVDYATILFSKFNIGYNAAEDEECEGEEKTAAGYGIYMSHCTGFAIEENKFYKEHNTPLGDYVGIRIAETQATDQVYKNTFEGLSYGNYAVGINHDPNYFFNGLAYYCNENTGNYADFYVEPDNDPNKFSGIQSKQGDDNNVTGNKFTPSGATWHFYNGGDYLVGYYYCKYCTNEDPDDNKEFHVTDKPKNFDNGCPSHYGGGGGGSGEGRGLVLTPEEKQETEMEFATNLTNYNNVKTLYDDLRDGGNTDATLTDIETSWPSDMWELRSELLGKSPHLSMEVLKATADKTDVLPDNVIFEIMAANPDELKKEELIKYLEEKENPLPDYMIDILRQVAEGTTYKTVLEQEMAHYNQVKTRAAYDIVRSILNDSVTDNSELRNWLDNIGGKRADEQIIASYLKENNFGNALAIAEMMPEMYGYSEYELAEHDYYLDMLNLQIQLSQEGRTVYDLDSNEVSNLVSIAENSTGTAGAQAKGILEFAYGYHYCNCLDVSDSTGFKSSGIINPEDVAKAYGLEINTEPNPASDWVAFNYTLPYDKSEGTIKIVDAKGIFVTSFKVTGSQGQKVWDTRELNSGVYFYTFIVGEFTRSGKIVLSK